MAPAEPVAIIGSGCRFPGSASSPSRLWNLLREPRNVASKPPTDRYNGDTFHYSGKKSLPPGMISSPESYFLEEDVRAFDAPFFNISPAEAASMDPQQRLLLEVVYESLDRAGLQLKGLQGSSTGVYCGAMNYDYSQLLLSDQDSVPPFMISGGAPSMLATRISYYFDWKGPSLVLDTACSSSLIALHLAVQALQKGDCSMAVAAGSSLILSVDGYVSSSQANMMSPSGRSHMWDEAADGYARGEGVAAVILKRLDDAVRDGDQIDAVIRATGVNCDGRTKSLTMPNGLAQGELISSTYAAAGLDPLNPADRCQFFEAHGTGTPAGDPQEAEGIANAFFNKDSLKDETMYVGSIKTVIGHTEAAAGIAGIMKAALAVQHGVIPPNMLFNRLSAKVAPFADHLRVPTKALPWPDLPVGAPRRVSVNSFGFGGANAHAIIESFSPYNAISSDNEATATPTFLPFVFSAASEKSLKAVLQQYVDWLQENPTVNLLDLAGSLLTKRSILSTRVIFTAGTVDGLIKKLQDELKDSSTTITRRLSPGPKRILGMGIDELQKSLDSLPLEYRPKYTLRDELAAPESSSRLNSAEISQPVRTALQIIQVNILRSLGIEFAAVVGHSSGEIAAAYAARWLSAADAIRVAYLRGLATMNAGSKGQPGGMLAVNISWDQAQAICGEAPYHGHVVVAASNSPSNVTLSGDDELISELEWLFESLDQTPRRLRVDTAYHSHHMIPCAEPYLQAMKACQVPTRQGSSTTKWFSSVHDAAEMTALEPRYWCENMLQSVQFSQALTAALKDQPDLDAIVEVGPHPALRGPALQTVSTVKPSDADVPYVGLGKRGIAGVEALALALGSFWAYLGPENIDTKSFVHLFSPSREPKFLPPLPTYPFDHSQTYWAVSQHASARTHRRLPRHPILGTMTPETGEGEWRWRNYLRQQDLEWVEGHKVESQMLFPATGYLVMAYEAAHLIAEDRVLQSVDIYDLAIDRAIAVPDTSMGVETLFTLYKTDGEEGQSLTASFKCQARFNDTFRCCATGRLEIRFGEQDETLLPALGPLVGGLQKIDSEHFYGELDKLGYGYSGLFRGLGSIQRRKDIAYGTIPVPNTDDDDSDLLVHPANLDTSLQALMAAFAYPGDGQLSGLFLPTRLARTSINPGLSRGGSLYVPQKQLTVEAKLSDVGKTGLTGDIHLFDSGGRGFVQIEGMHISPLTQLNPQDWPMFVEEVWGPLLPNSSLASSKTPLMPRSHASLDLCDRLALLYLRNAQSQLTREDCQKLEGHRGRYVAWMDQVLDSVRKGTHSLYPASSLQGDIASLIPVDVQRAKPVEILALETVNINLLPWLRGEVDIMEELHSQGDLLGRFQEDSSSLAIMKEKVATLVGQLSFRYPRMKILEVGAGTGGATRLVLEQIARDYHSYTYTDMTSASFEEAQQTFAAHSDRFIYETLDLEKDVSEQGFSENGYDLVIASNVLHATSSFKESISRIRRLLKPGGRLAVLDMTQPEQIASPFIFGGLPAWWRGDLDALPSGPLISRETWNQILRSSGFGEFETASSTEESKQFGMLVFTAQAVDDHIHRLQRPLSVAAKRQYRDLIIIGGASETTAELLPVVEQLVGPYFGRITTTNTIESFVSPENASLAAVLAVSDIDSPCLQDLTEERFTALQQIVSVTGKLLWVATGNPTEEPYLRMSKGFLRSLGLENPHAQFQHLAVKNPGALSPELVATTLMRLIHCDAGSDYSLPNCTENAEWELLLEDDVLKIPRMRTGRDMNQRWLTSRGVPNTRRVEPSETCVEVRPADDAVEESPLSLVSSFGATRYEPEVEYQGLKDACVRIRVHYATLPAVRVENGFLHLVIGEDEHNRSRVVALSETHASVVSTPASWCRPVPSWLPEKLEAGFLNDLSAALVARHLVRHAQGESTILIHEAPQSLQDAVSAMAYCNGIRVRYSAGSRQTSQGPGVLVISPRSSIRDISRLLPSGVSVLTTFKPDTDGSLARLQSSLSPEATYWGLKDLYGASFPPAHKQHSKVSDSLSASCLFAEQRSRFQTAIDTLTPEDIPAYPVDSHKLEIIDWLHSGPVLTNSVPSSSLVSLSGNKTFLLVGMTGDLGRSVTQWMITRGARTIVLTSRSPKIDYEWVEEMAALGARVEFMAMDVSNRDSVLKVHNHIEAKLPPVGGVINGAVVMRDAAFTDLSHANVLRVFGPKVEGSRILDELYQDSDLDFFILMGSFSGPNGNFHQTAYAAANEFMAALINQRRRRGQVGSIIHPAQIQGLGLILAMDAHMKNVLAQQLGPMALSERDILEHFAEAILAGRPDSGRVPEIGGGYRMTDPVEFPDVVWYRNPKLWSFIRHFRESGAAETSREDVPIKQQLLAADSISAAADIIADGFRATLRRKLHLPGDSALPGITLLTELGVDSLVAVDLRIWFVKELGVDVPVLQLLGGSSIDALTESAAGKLDNDLVPLIKTEIEIMQF
ncbi:ketoacyl-synt-domain-containing protein [Aspergillus steynii IBT 23096]|uniref:Ketoacyl-synt-domain-containing protein n=1 Tax=Aspergillus steynii IBT 23096 TaxID=1392250 RepID=A0A2I2GM79_9EURO|nr:ketoacyl-synt-domain-containing protein [Aspergillus steynii IBT 23096]PLB53988.1 ketoacyl-synt-domain-containing protein [Aspergillus steynii IBT 23096]